MTTPSNADQIMKKDNDESKTPASAATPAKPAPPAKKRPSRAKGGGTAKATSAPAAESAPKAAVKAPGGQDAEARRRRCRALPGHAGGHGL